MTNTSPQGKAEKPKEDKGLFLQVPYCVIDNLDMTDNAKIGFIRFCRLFNKKDKTIEFRGYYRGLASALKKSPAHTISIVDQWVKFNLVEREETLDGVILRANTVAIWHRNKIHRETHQCLNYEQQRLYEDKEVDSTVHDINTAVQNINTAVYKINGTIQNLNSSERKTAYTRLLDIARLLDSFLGEPDSGPEPDQQPALPEKNLPDLDVLCEDMGLIPFNSANHSYSQDTHTPTTDSSRLQENKAHQSSNPPLFQDIVPPESAAPKVVFPDMTKDLTQKDVRQLSKAEQKRIDEAEKKAEEKRIKDREADLWRMAERIASVVVETTYATKDVKAMAKSKMPLEDIEIIMQKYADAGMFDLTKIANYLPTYAARKLRKQPDEPAKITPFPSKSYQPAQPEVIPWKSKTPRNLGAHLNPADYDEEPYVVTR